MNVDFMIISDNGKAMKLSQGLEFIAKAGNNKLFCNPSLIKEYNGVKIYINGYILPRFHCFVTYKNSNQYELVARLFSDYGKEFLSYIKGIFSIIIYKDSTIRIFTDHLGILKLFYLNNDKSFICSNSMELLTANTNGISMSMINLTVKSLINHEINGTTIFKKIHYTRPATEILIDNNSVRFDNYFSYNTFLESLPEENTFLYFAQYLKELIDQYNLFLNPPRSVISLTGGKDCRTVLAGLLANSITPDGMTYGSPLSKDAVYAGILAKKAGIAHYIFDPEKNAEWFENMTFEIIGLGNPLINLHRGHRYYAFKEMMDTAKNDVAYYAGYMGGEFLMGVYYDNLIFTEFLTNSWEKQPTTSQETIRLLKKKFLNTERLDLSEIIDQYSELQTFNLSLSKLQRQFHGLFEIGTFHHSQDIYLSQNIFSFSIPLFMDIDFLQELFKSRFSFFFRDNKTRNVYKRYKLYDFNLNIQHILYQSFDTVPFAKRGSYNTQDFLRGPLYWSALKSFHYLSESNNFPASFTYNKEFNKFLVKWLNEIILDKTNEVNSIYNVREALKELSQSLALSTENSLLPFSSIVMHYLQLKHYSQKCIR